jgi:hypothetical protein
MKMGRTDPRNSMSRSVKGKSPVNKGGKNPFKSAGPYETPGVGECYPPTRLRPMGFGAVASPKADPVVDESSSEEEVG